MTKKPRKESQQEQSARFEKTVQDMIDAGELSPTEADEALEKLVLGLSTQRDTDDD